MLYRPPVNDLFDYKVYLEVDYDEVIRRGKERDVPLFGGDIIQRYIDFYIPLQQLYERQCSPKQQSHLVVNNNDVHRPVIL